MAEKTIEADVEGGCTTGIDAARGFIDAFYATKDGDDIGFNIGLSDKGTRLVVVHIDESYFGFTPPQARVMAEVFEKMIGQYPHASNVGTAADVSMSFRAAADRVEGKN